MSCRSTTEWVGYPRSTSVQRDSLPAIPAGNGEKVGTSIKGSVPPSNEFPLYFS